MLKELRIKNFAIIEEISFSFRKGMNILTGETGAGKSMIIQALNLILGDRAASNLVRNGEKEASVEALFSIPQNGTKAQKLQELGIETGEDLLIKRVISQEGKNRIFINGSMATIAILSEAAEGLASISGQHEHQTLLKADRHLELLDGFGKLQNKRQAYRKVFEEYREAKSALHSLCTDEKARQERADLIAFQSSEIEAAKIRKGEDEELEKDLKRLANAEKLLDAASTGESSLYSGEGSVTEQLAECGRKLAEAARIDSTLGEAAERINELLHQAEDIALSLREYADKTSADPETLKYVEDRLLQLDRLKKKYGPTLDEVIARGEKLSNELSLLDGSDSMKADLERSMKDRFSEALKLAEDLKAERRKAAKTLSASIVRELTDLGMGGALFEVSFSPFGEGEKEAVLTENGLEDAEFYLSANPGEAPKQLIKTASGGELSRIMLALKNCILERDRMPTLVFDEVDSGIGGATAEAVGRKIQKVSKSADVICITHLPQIAALGDNHFRVCKKVDKGRTFTYIEELSENERVEEIARMLGGSEITETNRKFAREMLSRKC